MWFPYSENVTEGNTEPGQVVLMTQALSKNGALGCCFIIKTEDGFVLDAASETTGRSWKSPDTIFDTIDKAKTEAEKLWIIR